MIDNYCIQLLATGEAKIMYSTETGEYAALFSIFLLLLEHIVTPL
jgi:hypothetical protein